jgi:hypothetical protein
MVQVCLFFISCNYVFFFRCQCTFLQGAGHIGQQALLAFAVARVGGPRLGPHSGDGEHHLRISLGAIILQEGWVTVEDLVRTLRRFTATPYMISILVERSAHSDGSPRFELKQFGDTMYIRACGGNMHPGVCTWSTRTSTSVDSVAESATAISSQARGLF